MADKNLQKWMVGGQERVIEIPAEDTNLKPKDRRWGQRSAISRQIQDIQAEQRSAPDVVSEAGIAAKTAIDLITRNGKDTALGLSNLLRLRRMAPANVHFIEEPQAEVRDMTRHQRKKNGREKRGRLSGRHARGGR